MPTTRPRHTLTETPQIATALDLADAAWPEFHGDRAALLRRLVELGGQSVAQISQDRIAVRKEALHRVAGALTGVYPPDAAATLKAEWPE